MQEIEKVMHELDRLHFLQAQVDGFESERAERRDAVLENVQPALDEIEHDINERSAPVVAEVTALTSSIKAEVLALQATVKSDHLMAVYKKGVETWDGKALTGFAAAHPEILAFKKVGSPVVVISPVKQEA